MHWLVGIVIIISTLLVYLAPTVAVAAEESPASADPTSQTATDCNKGSSFFGLPTWYKYLEFEQIEGTCSVKVDDKGQAVTLVLLAIGEIMLYVSGFLAVIFVIVGGFKYIISQGEPQNIANSRKTILNAIIGLVIVLISAQLVKFIATKIGG